MPSPLPIPEGLREDGSGPSVPLSELLAEHYLDGLIRTGKLICDSDPLFGRHSPDPVVEAIIHGMHGIAETFGRATMNAFCGIMHPTQPEDGPIVWSMPERVCGMCGNRLGDHPQASRTIERIGPYMQTHLTRGCNGALLDFGGWAPETERAWWRRVDELKAQGKWGNWT